MLWLLLLLPVASFAQNSFPVIEDLGESLPDYQDFNNQTDAPEVIRHNTRHEPPTRIVKLETIINSGTQKGAIPYGVPIFEIETNKTYKVPELIYVNFFNLEDEFGYKYISGKDGKARWKLLSRHVEPIKQELELYVPPHIYTPATKEIPRENYDTKLAIIPEAVFQMGITTPTYMQELFLNSNIGSGKTFIFGANVFTNWKLPFQIGATLKIENTTYAAGSGMSLKYTSTSFGPIIKTKDFEFMDKTLRLYAEFRYGPFAKADIDYSSFKFNSTDLSVGAEHPIKNRFGEFVIGAFVQTQWLSIKDQQELVSLSATNKTNRLFGLSLSQVFQ